MTRHHYGARTFVRAAAVAVAVPALLVAAAGAAAACNGSGESRAGAHGCSGRGCGGDETSFSPRQSSTCEGVPTLAALGQAGSFSEFAIHDATRGKASASDAQGAVAYGGNVTFDHFYVGAYSTAAKSLVVGRDVAGTVTLANGSKGVLGGVNSATSANVAGAAVSGLKRGSSPVDFESTGSRLREISSLYGSEPTSADATITQDGRLLTLTGTNAAFNVFSLPAGVFAQAQTIFVHVPVGATTLINVPDAALPSTLYQDFQYWDGTSYQTGNQYGSAAEKAVQDATLLNFPAASGVTFGAANLAANVLAPRATFTFNNGVLNGSVFADNIVGDFQSNLTRPFAGRCSAAPRGHESD